MTPPAVTAIERAALEINAARGVARYLSQAASATLDQLGQVIKGLGDKRRERRANWMLLESEGAEQARLLSLFVEYRQRRAAQSEAEERAGKALDLLVAELRQPGPASASDRPADPPETAGDLCAALELHADETGNEMSRIADAVERIAARLEGTATPHGESRPAP